LSATLAVLGEAREPGEVVHLPFVWPEAPKQTNWHPSEISPIVKLFLKEIKHAGAAARK
jgi:hypothetical protein